MFICIFIGFKIRKNKPSTDSDSAQNFASFGAWFGFQYITVDPVSSRVRLLEKATLYYTLFLLAKLTYESYLAYIQSVNSVSRYIQ